MADENKSWFAEKLPKVLGMALFLLFFFAMNLGPQFFPEFFEETFANEQLFGGFAQPEYAVYGAIIGIVAFLGIPFLFAPVLVRAARAKKEKWSYLAFFSVIIVAMFTIVLVVKFVNHCGGYIARYYGNTLIEDNFIFVIWGYFLLFGILRTVIVIKKK